MSEVEATKEVGPDINSFVVQLKDGSGAGDEGVGWAPMATSQVLVVFEPVWLFVEVGREAFCFGKLFDEIRHKVSELDLIHS